MQVVVNEEVIRRGLRLAILAAAVFGLCKADDTVPSNEIPLADWLRASDRQDFRWQVRVGQPWLTFQQRRLTQVEVSFRVSDLLKAGISLPDLYFVVKLGTEDGKWFKGQSYRRFVPPPDLKPSDGVRSLANLYVAPGTYRVVVMAYDALHRRGNLVRQTLRVPVLKDDPLPGLDRDLPKVEFLPPANPMRIGRGRFQALLTMDPWALGSGDLVMPVATTRPVIVDVVANVSLSEVTNLRHSEAPEWSYQINAATLLQAGHVLSQLDLKNGCIRLSMIDLRRQKIFVDHEEVPALDWAKIRHKLETLNRNKIDVAALAGQKQEPAFLAHYLEGLWTAPYGCQLSGPQPTHVLVMISDAFVFPNGARMTTVDPLRMPGSEAYYVRLVPVVGGRWDEIKSVLNSVRPVQFDIANSREFRKVLAHLMASMGNAPAQRSQHH